MLTFSDRLRAVIGPEEATHAWAMRHNMHPPKVWDWLKHHRTPRRLQIAELAEKTGIPLSWWLKGEFPPPKPEWGAPYLKEADNPLPPQQLLEPAPQPRVASRINVDALAAIIEGAIKIAPHAGPEALARHCAKIYAQAIDDGLITADGVGDGHLDTAA